MLNNLDRNAAWEEDLMAFLAEAKMKVIAIVLDKLEHRRRYVAPYPPYSYCMMVLMERYQGLLNRLNAKGDAMAESRSGSLDMQLKTLYQQVWDKGTRFCSPSDFRARFTSKELKVKQKVSNVPGLQLADLLAYPARLHVLRQNDCLVEPFGSCSGRIMDVLEDNMLSYRTKLIK